MRKGGAQKSTNDKCVHHNWLKCSIKNATFDSDAEFWAEDSSNVIDHKWDCLKINQTDLCPVQ